MLKPEGGAASFALPSSTPERSSARESRKAAMQELATRLEQASRQLDGALYDARRNVEVKEGMTLAANREKEIASRLKDRARANLEEWRENKLAALPRYRRMQRNEES